jgi:P-type Cu2+ transporter
MNPTNHHNTNDHSKHSSAPETDHSQHAGMDHASQSDHGNMNHSAHAGHGTDHTGHEQMFRVRFWWSLLLSIPVLLYSEMIQMWLGFTPPAIPFAEWIPFVFSVVIFVYGGLPFLNMAVPELKDRKPGMMTLISLAISVAFVYSVAAQFIELGEGFFWELVTLIDIMLLGHWLEMRSVRQASGALNELAKLMPDTAERIHHGDHTETVPVPSLKHGDLVLVRPGASIPADGEVMDGHSNVNEAMVTGESKPVHKMNGMKVIAGTINGDGSLRVRVTATGNETALAGIMRLVEQAQGSKSKTQVLADKAAGWLFYIALAAALVTGIAWTLADAFNLEVLTRVVTVLVIACPHALGLAIPLVVAITTALGARNGILVRDRLALEAAREIDVVIFDKTGTLTQGQFGVVDIVTVDASTTFHSAQRGWDFDRALALASALESDSEHLIATAIRRFARDRKLVIPPVSHFSALKGRGVQADFDNQTYYVGGPRLLEMLSLTPKGNIRTFTESANNKSQTVVYLTTKAEIIAAISIADVIRPESKQAIDELHKLGIEVAMLTGDSQAVAKAVASQLGIERVFAEVLPEHKDEKIDELQKLGKRVAMVGDGVNDAPALTRADVGIAIGGGTDVAIESAGIVLVHSNPLDVVKIFKLSRASYRKMIQNLWWAAGYNIVAIPLAAGVLAGWGILLSPAIGAVLMSISTIVVALNAQLLRKVNLWNGREVTTSPF